jgi:hypothetical protein
LNISQVTKERDTKRLRQTAADIKLLVLSRPILPSSAANKRFPTRKVEQKEETTTKGKTD